jgi:hypothetical protein
VRSDSGMGGRKGSSADARCVTRMHAFRPQEPPTTNSSSSQPAAATRTLRSRTIFGWIAAALPSASEILVNTKCPHPRG